MTLLQEQPLEQVDLGPGEHDFHFICPICWISIDGEFFTAPDGYLITACGVGVGVDEYVDNQSDDGPDCAACVAALRVRGGFPCGHTFRETSQWMADHQLGA